MPSFCHLHNHTQYSLLDGASSIKGMVDKAVTDGQTAVAITDHGNMFGAFKFVTEANKKGIKPIVGCEFYLVEDRHRKSFSRKKGEKDKRFHQLLLAKDAEGYKNLSKLCSLGYIDGLYSDFPRIDKELVLQYHEGLIATSCCIGAEIPQALLRGDDEKAEELVRWWLDLFGEDFYIELQRHHGLEDIDGLGISQEDINQKLILLAARYNIRTIATNDAHYINEEDYKGHDILLCINTGNKLDEEARFRFSSSDFYFKSQAEMNQLFQDVPQAIDNTQEIVDKISPIDLRRDVVLPEFPLPAAFHSQDQYLRHLTYEGAKKRYGTIDQELQDRLDFELKVIEQSGYPGYFLIVQDFTSAARDMKVSVGPGRGSAAGSAVAYCLGITNVDPIRYDLLFERFLNPERISLPDIDIDFDDEGRSKVIDYVIKKYGHDQVAQIITFGTMAAKMSIRDVGRVLGVELDQVDKVAKAFPTHLSATLNAVLAEKDIQHKLKEKLNQEDLEKAYKIRAFSKGDDIIGKMLRSAKELEGSVRSTGIHACGVIITPEDIRNYIPVSMPKGSEMWVSQFDNSVVEDAGLLKMDFLGLKTLTIIKDSVNLIEKRHGRRLDMDEIPLDDPNTYELLKHGDTIGIFQYESPGMQKHLRELKPSRLEDLIAMNALYRPGPMAYIPNFIARKHGKEEIRYDLPEMEEYLAETYGITVYQEQVMLLSQKLAGFSKGQADMLRKGMGKKKKKIIDELYPKFVEGCLLNGHDKNVVDKIWNDWEAFASYAFNKSHSTCYAIIGFQTAYLKANYPAEFMAPVLSHNKSDLSKVNFFLRESRKMGLEVLGPDINESDSNFSVNDKGQVRIGLSALKGLGESAADEIIRERDENGPFECIFSFMQRVNLKSVNKKSLECLAQGGGFDSFGLHRAQYFSPSEKYDTFIEHLIRYGQAVQQQRDQQTTSLFGEMGVELINKPEIPETEEWSFIEKLNVEKEVTGIYVSGHPLDIHQLELAHYITCELRKLNDVKKEGRKVNIAGIAAGVRHGMNRKGNGYCRFSIQDYNGTFDLGLYQENYEKFGSLIKEGQVIFVEAVFAKRYQSEDLYLRINDIRLLSSIGQTKTKSITLRLSTDMITSELIGNIEKLCSEYQGMHALKMKLVGEDENVCLDLKSTGLTVNADLGFITSLGEMGVTYRLN